MAEVAKVGLGRTRNTTEEGLDYILSGLSDKNPATRLAAADAAGRIPSDHRARFREELQHLLSRPDESEETRNLALEALRQ